jgi:hypothetical protein
MHEHLRTFHDHIVQLVTSDYAEAVALKARTSPLGEIVSFIESHPPSLDPIAAAVLKDLRRPETMADLGVRVGRAPLHDVRGFIFMARQRMPEICNDLIDRLREPAALDTISGRIAADPNEHFIGFIRMMEERDQTFGGKLLNRLAEESLVLVLARRLFDAPIHTVVQFLQYFGRESPNLRQRLVTAMGDVGNQILTVRSFYRSNTLHWLLSECSMVQTSPEDKYAELARELRGEPREYIYLARAFEACLPNLAKYAASVVMLGGSEARWRRAYLEEVLHCVRIASDLPEMNRHHFLSRVARRSWLREQFTAAEPGPLARVTFLLWITLKFPERRIFINEFLVKALNNTFARSLASAAVAIPLLASAKLLHVDLKVLPGSWHSDVEINAALDELIGNEDSSQTRLSFKLAAFWVGLKVLTRMRKVAIQIAPRSGTETLQRWLAAKPETDRVEQFNSVMIGWLTMCAENQWRLTIDSEPFDP